MHDQIDQTVLLEKLRGLRRVDVRDPEGDRIHVRRVRELVDHRLGREERLRRLRRTEVRALQEALVAVDPLARDAPVRNGVERAWPRSSAGTRGAG